VGVTDFFVFPIAVNFDIGKEGVLQQTLQRELVRWIWVENHFQNLREAFVSLQKYFLSFLFVFFFFFTFCAF
jgi:hypothetical protein